MKNCILILTLSLVLCMVLVGASLAGDRLMDNYSTTGDETATVTIKSSSSTYYNELALYVLGGSGNASSFATVACRPVNATDGDWTAGTLGFQNSTSVGPLTFSGYCKRVVVTPSGLNAGESFRALYWGDER